LTELAVWLDDEEMVRRLNPKPVFDARLNLAQRETRIARQT
jgi:hypothetical protein